MDTTTEFWVLSLAPFHGWSVNRSSCTHTVNQNKYFDHLKHLDIKFECFKLFYFDMCKLSVLCVDI